MKIRHILFSQPAPSNLSKSPYAELQKNHGVEIDFYKFFRVEGLSVVDFRKEKINILDYPSIIMTSKNAIDHFFRIVTEMKIKLPISLKYFCINEAIAFYLQKHIVFRKRKIFYPEQGTVEGLVEQIEKNNNKDKLLLPCSLDSNLNLLVTLLDTKPEIHYTKAEVFKIDFPNLQEAIDIYKYDMIVLFSPYGIQSLFQSFPDYQQDKTIFGALGERVVAAAQEAGLQVEVWAPQPEFPSIFSALDHYLRLNSKKK